MSKLILGTAGHIDHGKTALVRALTGVDTDRLPEEKKRGITIDLGFASLELGGHDFGVVDVPGHEGFIRNMLAGATGMDAVLLVVAADEGVMPQTREHLAILDLLDVRSGVVAITKSDLADADWTQLVADDVRAKLRGTSLEHAPVVPVSARTGAGLDALRSAIVAQATRPAGRRSDDVFRLPIDRVFTVRGTGTVVTGTIWSGEVRPDATVWVMPAGITARVRGVQVHGVDVEAALAGERAAIALSGIDKSAVERGAVLLDEEWTAARMVLAQLRLIGDTEWQVRNRQRVHVHIGTTEVLARVVLLDRDRLEAGDSAWVQLRLEQPIIARVGDRVVIRSYSPVTTIGGGVIAALSEGKQTRLLDGQEARLEAVLSNDAVTAVRALLADSPKGQTISALAQQTPHARSDVLQAIEQLGDDVVAIGDRWFSAAIVEAAVAEVSRAADRLHAENPLKPTIERAELRGAIQAARAVIDHALALAIERGELVANGSGVVRPGFSPTLNARQQALRGAVLQTLSEAGLAAPTLAELGRSLGEASQLAELMRLLENEGRVRAVAPDLYIEANVLQEAELRTRRELAGSNGLSAAEFRATLPVTRKHLIPILEYFDRCGITMRNGDLRSVPAASVNDLRGTS